MFKTLHVLPFYFIHTAYSSFHHVACNMNRAFPSSCHFAFAFYLRPHVNFLSAPQIHQALHHLKVMTLALLSLCYTLTISFHFSRFSFSPAWNSYAHLTEISILPSMFFSIIAPTSCVIALFLTCNYSFMFYLGICLLFISQCLARNIYSKSI